MILSSECFTQYTYMYVHRVTDTYSSNVCIVNSVKTETLETHNVYILKTIFR